MIDYSREAADELITFLSAYTLATLLANPKYKASLRSGYRRYHALMIWHANLAQGAIWQGEQDKERNFIVYLEECTSDLCQSMLMSLQGLYKPAYLLLRSGVENFFRVVGIYDDQNVLSLTSVYELIAVVKTTKSVKSSSNSKKQIVKLVAAYAELCNHAHSSGERYMSLENLVGNFPGFNEKRNGDYQALFRTVVVSICSILCLLFRVQFLRMHHRSIDFISDVLPKDIRREIRVST